jgi:glycosyltransferase involved in cell wall biosynthesis
VVVEDIVNLRSINLASTLYGSLDWNDTFLLRDFFHRLDSKKIKVGFCISGIPKPYNKVMASTRLRVYDIIKHLNQTTEFSAELYKNWKRSRYDIVIFQNKAYNLATELKKKGIKIILDVNVNYYEKSNKGFVKEDQRKDIFSFTKIADAIITTTEYLELIIAKYFQTKNIITIPENINEIFFAKRKMHIKKEVIKLLYVGYSVKASEILLIKDVLEELGKRYKLQMIFICDENPEIKFENLESKFIKYKQNRIHLQLMEGDIKIASRALEDSYNKAHSFTKIGYPYPMAVGIPVIASPVDSYKNSPAILCSSKEEWAANLEKLVMDHEYREELSKKGVEYCKKFSKNGQLIWKN